MKKKIVLSMLTVSMLSLAACGKGGSKDSDKNDAGNSGSDNATTTESVNDIGSNDSDNNDTNAGDEKNLIDESLFEVKTFPQYDRQGAINKVVFKVTNNSDKRTKLTLYYMKDGEEKHAYMNIEPGKTQARDEYISLSSLDALEYRIEAEEAASMEEVLDMEETFDVSYCEFSDKSLIAYYEYNGDEAFDIGGADCFCVFYNANGEVISVDDTFLSGDWVEKGKASACEWFTCEEPYASYEILYESRGKSNYGENRRNDLVTESVYLSQDGDAVTNYVRITNNTSDILGSYYTVAYKNAAGEVIGFSKTGFAHPVEPGDSNAYLLEASMKAGEEVASYEFIPTSVHKFETTDATYDADLKKYIDIKVTEVDGKKISYTATNTMPVNEDVKYLDADLYFICYDSDNNIIGVVKDDAYLTPSEDKEGKCFTDFDNIDHVEVEILCKD